MNEIINRRWNETSAAIWTSTLNSFPAESNGIHGRIGYNARWMWWKTDMDDVECKWRRNDARRPDSHAVAFLTKCRDLVTSAQPQNKWQSTGNSTSSRLDETSLRLVKSKWEKVWIKWLKQLALAIKLSRLVLNFVFVLPWLGIKPP